MADEKTVDVVEEIRDESVAEESHEVEGAESVTRRVCACGCGKLFEPRQRGQLYLNPKHRERGRAKEKEPAKTGEDRERLYFLSLKSDAPFFSVALGGVCFPRRTHSLAPDGRGILVPASEKQGDFVPMRESKARELRREISNYVVRWNANHSRGWKVSKKDINYKPLPGDEPMAKYVVLIEAEGLNAYQLYAGIELPTLHEVSEAHAEEEKPRRKTG